MRELCKWRTAASSLLPSRRTISGGIRKPLESAGVFAVPSSPAAQNAKVITTDRKRPEVASEAVRREHASAQGEDLFRAEQRRGCLCGRACERLRRQCRMTVAILIVNWNGGDLLTRCLQSVEQQRRRPDHIVVVDNASTDDSLK